MQAILCPSGLVPISRCALLSFIYHAIFLVSPPLDVTGVGPRSHAFIAAPPQSQVGLDVWAWFPRTTPTTNFSSPVYWQRWSPSFASTPMSRLVKVGVKGFYSAPPHLRKGGSTVAKTQKLIIFMSCLLRRETSKTGGTAPQVPPLDPPLVLLQCILVVLQAHIYMVYSLYNKIC